MASSGPQASGHALAPLDADVLEATRAMPSWRAKPWPDGGHGLEWHDRGEHTEIFTTSTSASLVNHALMFTHFSAPIFFSLTAASMSAPSVSATARATLDLRLDSLSLSCLYHWTPPPSSITKGTQAPSTAPARAIGARPRARRIIPFHVIEMGRDQTQYPETRRQSF